MATFARGLAHSLKKLRDCFVRTPTRYYCRGRFIRLSKCRNVVSKWDTSGSWLMYVWHMAKYEEWIIIFHRNREPSAVLLMGIVISNPIHNVKSFKMGDEMRWDKSSRVMLVFFSQPHWVCPTPGEITPSYILHTRAFRTYLLGGLFTLQKRL
jgi:hypothetical protein